ncbi:MAG: hypothetical protein Q8R11_03150 [bacterium]|nr:hypothetical protein [bacterium]
MVELTGFYVECSKVEKDLRTLIGLVKGQLAFNKRILVPKTMIVGNRNDNFNRLGLLTSLDSERYQPQMAAEVLDYESEFEITYDRIPTLELIGREHGECSILLDLDSLRKFRTLVFSERLDTELRRKNAVVAYCLGGKYYFCADSIQFVNIYYHLVSDIRIDGRFTR